MKAPAKPNVWARRKARRALVQAMYQWHVSATPASALVREFGEGTALHKADAEFFTEMLELTLASVAELDALLEPVLDRRLDQLDVVELAVLRLAVAELKDRVDVPYRVVIDEYVELAKVFGGQDSHKFVNGVLDKLAGELRALEVQSARG